MAQHTPATSRAGTFGAILRVTSGNFLEQFDFFLFGFYATYIARTFFPAVKRDTENAKTGQRKYEKTIFRILCVKPPISGGFLSMFKPLLKPFESSLQSIS